MEGTGYRAYKEEEEKNILLDLKEIWENSLPIERNVIYN